nr:MAG TPA: hypothetical protein [Caudoviricetes sp.]
MSRRNAQAFPYSKVSNSNAFFTSVPYLSHLSNNLFGRECGKTVVFSTEKIELSR